MNVIIIIVKKKSPHGNIPQGVCQTTKKNKKTTQQRRHRVLITQDPNCIKGNRVSKLLLSIDEQKKRHIQDKDFYVCLVNHLEI